MSDGEPTLEDLKQEFPRQWEFFHGVNLLPYGRLKFSSPPVVFMGEDTTDLRDQINGYLGKQEGNR